MRIELTPHEARAIGCLIEKQITSPDQYPLSLNALTSACNQKSNRDPVLKLTEIDIQALIDSLVKKHLVVERTGFGSRVPKYAHRFCNTEFGDLKLTAQELGVACELLLRGPQTPGELRTHTSRLCSFADSAEVESVLQNLEEREDGPFVVRLAREPGRRESRYAHLFSGEVDVGTAPDPDPAPRDPAPAEVQAAASAGAQAAASAGAQTGASAAARVTLLEEQVATLRRDMEAVKRHVGMD